MKNASVMRKVPVRGACCLCLLRQVMILHPCFQHKKTRRHAGMNGALAEWNKP
jgi:hypothetical protein